LPLTIHFVNRGEHAEDVFLEGNADVAFTGSVTAL